MKKHESNKYGHPNERFIWWMQNVPDTGCSGRGYTSAHLARSLGCSRGYIDAIRQGKKPLTKEFALKIACFDKKRIADSGGDPITAVRWSYLMGYDDYPTEMDVQKDPLINELPQEAIVAWLQVRTEELMTWVFNEAGFTCKSVDGGFYDITPKENYKTRRITQKVMDDALDAMNYMACSMAKLVYDRAGRKETVANGVNKAEDNEGRE